MPRDPSPLDDQLLSAASFGNVKRVKAALAEGADPNATAPFEVSALGLAAMNGAAAVIPVLVAAGAKVDRPDPGGSTPLMHAAEHGKLKAIAALLAAGANVNARGASTPQTDRMLAETGTPLVVAAKRGRADAVKALLDAGADASLTDADGLTALDWAARSQHPRVLALLRRVTPARKKPGVIELVAAARDGDVKAVRSLLAAGAALNAIEPDWFPRGRDGTLQINSPGGGRTALMIAAANGHADLVRALLDAGADTEILSTTRNRSERTALGFAVEEGHADVVRQLLAAGAELHPKGSGVSLIHQAVEAGDPEVLRLLIGAGANVNEPLHRSTPLHTAAKQGQPAAVKVLLEAGAKPDPKDWERKTPLREAAAGGCPRSVQSLLDAGADPNTKDQDGYTPLAAAVMTATNLPGSRKEYVEVARLLLSAGADPAPAREALRKERIRSKALLRISDMLDEAPLASSRRPAPVRKKKLAGAGVYADAPVPDFRDRAKAAAFRKAVAELTGTLKRTPCPFEHDVPGAVFFRAKKAKAERIVGETREKLLRSGVTVFRCGDALRPDDEDCVALLPTTDVYEAVAAVSTNAANYGRGSAGVIAGLKEVEKESPFVLTAIGYDYVEGRFLAPSNSPTRLARKLYDLNEDVGPIDQVAERLRKDRRLYLWWD